MNVNNNYHNLTIVIKIYLKFNLNLDFITK